MMTRFRRDERGFVLVVVVLSLTFLMVLVTGVMDYSIGSQNISRRDQDWNAALAAAEAGVDDYVFRLNQDGAYWRFGAPPDPDGTDGNPAFTAWTSVPGSANEGEFRYTVTGTPDATGDGTIRLVSSGRVRGVVRSIQTTLRRRNFLDYLYFTNYETKDPAIYIQPPDDYTPTEAGGASGNGFCNKYYYGAVGSRRDIGTMVRTDFTGDTDGDTCTEISFASVDVINGPLHSNDAIRINGSPTFNGPTSTSYDGSLNSGQRWWGSSGASPNFTVPGDPAFATPLIMPPTNSALENETNPALGGTGCLFTGPTAIRLNADATMDVISPFSKVINCSTSPNPDSNLYYSGGNGFTITRMQLPPNGVIYVQNVPTGSDANATTGCPFNREAIGGTGSGNPNRSHPLGFPQAFDISTMSTGTLASGYGCRNGDVFLMGTLDGRLTIAAENNIVAFGNTTYEDPAGDLLGLIANNYIEVYHPARTDGSTTNCDGAYAGQSGQTGCALMRPTASSSSTPSLFTGTTPGTSTISTQTSGSSQAFRNPVIKGAILTVLHSFRVQHYQYGDNDVTGTLNVTGAIAQQFRGIVGLINTTGYAKNYVYDQRLKYDSPPKFLNPVAAAYQVVTWAECRTVDCQPSAA